MSSGREEETMKYEYLQHTNCSSRRRILGRLRLQLRPEQQAMALPHRAAGVLRPVDNRLDLRAARDTTMVPLSRPRGGGGRGAETPPPQRGHGRRRKGASRDRDGPFAGETCAGASAVRLSSDEFEFLLTDLCISDI